MDSEDAVWRSDVLARLLRVDTNFDTLSHKQTDTDTKLARVTNDVRILKQARADTRKSRVTLTVAVATVATTAVTQVIINAVYQGVHK